MARALYRMGRWIADHRLLVLAVWVATVAAVTIVVGVVGHDTSNDLRLPGTDSQQATDLLAARFPPQQNGKSPIVFATGRARSRRRDHQKAINQAATAIRKVPHVASAVNPFSQQGAAQLSKDGRTAFIAVLLDMGSADLTVEEAQAVLDAAEPRRARRGITLAAGRADRERADKPDTSSSE